METYRDLIVALAYENQGEYRKVMDALTAQAHIDITPENTSEQAITLLDENYPNAFIHAPHPPVAMFYQGNTELLNKDKKHIGFIDDFTQADTQEGIYNRELIIDTLNNAHTCVLKHEIGKDNKTLEALKKRPEIAIILICNRGIDLNDNAVKYVLENNGLVLSSAPTTLTEPTFYSSDYAELMLAYLSDLVYVNEINYCGFGSLYYSTNRDIPVATSPYSNFKALRYNNELIKQGCEVILNSLDFDNLLLH